MRNWLSLLAVICLLLLAPMFEQLRPVFVTTDALAEAHAEVTPRVVGWFTSLALNSELFAAVAAYAATDEAAALTGEHRRYLDKTLDDFKRQGADLPDEQKRLIVAPPTDFGNPASKAAFRPIFGEPCATFPIRLSSTKSGSTPDLATACLIACAAIVIGGVILKPPRPALARPVRA